MSVFTPVTPEQLSAWIKHYSIGALTHLEGIAAGIENTNYFVTTTHGRYVLTLFEKLRAAELPFYLDLMAHLARHGIPCPQPIANLDNEYLGALNGKPASIVTCVPGTDLKQVNAEHCATIGALLAEMHLASASYRAEMPNPRGPSWWKTALPKVLPFLDPNAAALLKEEVRFQSLY
ncbi:MAG TPA: phosphotransferase, partial [Burkholderiales bacterium]|nr:phosphotransferase [Burkholderiales bacterium]